MSSHEPRDKLQDLLVEIRWGIDKRDDVRASVASLVLTQRDVLPEYTPMALSAAYIHRRLIP